MNDTQKPLHGASPDVGAMMLAARECRQRQDLLGALERYEAVSHLRPGFLQAQQSAANTLLELGRVEESESRFRALIDRFPQSVWPRCGLGQALRRRRAFSDALDQYEAALRIDPTLFDAHLGRAETLSQLGRLAEAESQLQALTKVAPTRSVVWTGLATIHRKRGDFRSALTLLENSLVLIPEHPLINGMIGQMQMLLGRHDEAEVTFRRMLDRDPTEFESLRGLAEIAVHQRNLPHALGWLGSAERAAPRAVAIKLRIQDILCQLNRFEAAEEVLERIRMLRPDSSEFYLAAGRFEHHRGRYQAALEHFSNAIARAPDDFGIRFHVVDMCIALSQTAEADAELARIVQLVGVDDPRLQAKTLECLCRTLRFDEALTFASRWKHYAEVPDGAVGIMLGLFATLERWRDVFEFFRERVVRKSWAGSFTAIGRVLLQAARETKQYREALCLLQEAYERAANPEVAACICQIKAEIDLVEQLEPGADPARGSSTPPSDACGPTASIGTLLRTLTGATECPRAEVFTCTDGNYLIAAALCIFSLLRTNLQSVRSYRISVYCADEALNLATTVFRSMAGAFGTAINVRASSDILSVKTPLRSGYGFFSRGKAMAASAYYRIYAARRLLGETPARRMIYLDADTCIQVGFGRLVDFELQGHPLGARLDDSGEPGVRRAASILEIDPERYFNSGVLLFDRSHPELKRLLDRTIEIVEHEQDKLTFHDQCALNLAFCERFAMLPDSFNHFVKPGVTEIVGDADPIVIHFGAHPKPWDPVSEDPKKLRWLEECAALAQVIGSQSLREMLALCFAKTLARHHPAHT